MYKYFKSANFKRNLSLLIVIIVSIIFYRVTENVHILDFVPKVLKVLSPFIIGIIFAYILNPPVRYIEKSLLKIKWFRLAEGKSKKTQADNAKKRRFARNTAIFSAMVIVIGVIIWVVAYILPEMILSVQKIVDFFMNLDYTNIRFYIARYTTRYNIHLTEEQYELIFSTITQVLRSFINGLKYLPEMFQSVLDYTIGFAKAFINVIVGIFVTVYILADKENVLEKCKAFSYIFFSHSSVENIKKFIKTLNTTFESFFVGKFIDSFIIGVIFFVGAMIMDLPYMLLLSLVIGVTNMIPYFGPFIGAVPVCVLVLFVDPVKCLWVIIFIIILQQFDGVILGPKILGDSIGIKPLGVIFAITVGGAIAGPLGMFFGVPVFSVLIKSIMEFGDICFKRKSGGVLNE